MANGAVEAAPAASRPRAPAWARALPALILVTFAFGALARLKRMADSDGERVDGRASLIDGRASLQSGASLPGAGMAAALNPRCAAAALAACESSADALALEGTDVVEYFRSGARVLGSAQYSSPFGESTFNFQSAGNRAVFDSAPASFASRVGGFCAFQFSGADEESHLRKFPRWT
ncbi:hypothetical protein M885DRAFT_567938 [Pelagophyceae sp. CCMP2097]|nr:hypothetical protein M885DRAFT_567938 [Pelagophyceae sp. CCMP2097]